MSHAPGLTVGSSSTGAVRVDERHAAMLAQFYRQVWDPGATAERVCRARAEEAAANPAVPGEDIPTFAFISGGQMLGHVTTIPVRLWAGGTERPAHWVKGLMVLPEYRNGPVGFFVLKEAVHHLEEAMALVVQPPARRLFEALDFREVGALANYLRVLRPAPLLQELDHGALGLSRLPAGVALMIRLARRPGVAAVMGRVISGAFDAWTKVGGRWHGLALQLSPRVPEAVECDALWEEVRPELLAAPARNSGYLQWRYERIADGSYTFVTVRNHSKLLALAVVRAPGADGDPRLKGIRVATVSDLIFPPRDSRSGLAALEGAEAVARELAADALLCTASHRSVAPLLRRRAFVGLQGTLHFLLRTTGGGRSLPLGVGDWWLTRGDSYADAI